MSIQREHPTCPKRRATSRPPYLSRKTLLTPSERRFYHDGLKPAVSDRYLISFKVRLADVIRSAKWEDEHGRRIAQKHLDFVLISCRLTRIVAAVELNDSTHSTAKRQVRDAFLRDALNGAGIPLVTFPVYRHYDPSKIRQRLSNSIGSFRRR